MKRFRLYQRASRQGAYFCIDTVTRKHISLGTRDEG